MLTHPTLDQMHQLGLAGMARAFAELQANPQSADLSHANPQGQQRRPILDGGRQSALNRYGQPVLSKPAAQSNPHNG